MTVLGISSTLPLKVYAEGADDSVKILVPNYGREATAKKNSILMKQAKNNQIFWRIAKKFPEQKINSLRK